MLKKKKRERRGREEEEQKIGEDGLIGCEEKRKGKRIKKMRGHVGNGEMWGRCSSKQIARVFFF
jgi:hypothetical protein